MGRLGVSPTRYTFAWTRPGTVIDRECLLHVSSIDIHSIINAAVHPVADVIKDGQDFVSSDIRTRQKASIHRIRINSCRI